MADLARRRALAQRLDRPDGDRPEETVRALLALQGQELVSVRRAIRARTRGVTAAQVDALLDDGALVITWLNRGTLHLVTPEDLPWLHGLTAPRTQTANARRLAQEGVPPEPAERGVRAVVEALAEHGPLTRDELREPVARAGVRTEGQALVHVLMLAGLRGLTVRGPVRSRAMQAYALTRDWLGVDPPAPLVGEARDRALAELARRYLRGHGPASDRDLATWAGLPLGDARRGLAAIAGKLEEGPAGLVDLRDRRSAGRLSPALLPNFDPLLVGWKRRDHVIAPKHQEGYQAANGVIPAVAVDGGRAVGTWTAPGGQVDLRPFAGVDLDERQRRAFAREAGDLARFEGR